MTAEGNGGYWIPIFGKPKKNRKSRTSNGMLRIVSTYAVPAARRGATGLTRIDATTTPMASATAKLASVRARVSRNALANAPKLWTRTFKRLLRRGGHGGRRGHGRGHRRGGCGGHGRVPVHRRWRRGGDPSLTDGPVEGCRPGAVLVAGLAPVVDEG